MTIRIKHVWDQPPTKISEDPGPYECVGKIEVVVWVRKLSISPKHCEHCVKKRAFMHVRLEMPDQKTVDRYSCDACLEGWLAKGDWGIVPKRRGGKR